MINITDEFVDELYTISNVEYTEEIVQKAKYCILDYLGVAFAGTTILKNKNVNINKLIQFTTGNSTVIGFNKKTSNSFAALINGISAHSTELDDGVRYGAIHPGAPIISAILSMAETDNVSGGRFISGVITGYEAAVRLASAIQPEHKKHGFHATGTCGTIGAAIGVAVALGYSRAKIKDTLSIAATTASGILKVQDDSSELKSFNAGNAAMNGVTSALLSDTGFCGPEDVLGGAKGFISMMSDDPDLTHLKSGNELALEKVYKKTHAACRHSHSAIDAVLEQKRKIKNIDDIDIINVRTYSLGIDGHDHIDIHGVASAKLSTPYSIAAALAFGKVGIKEYSDKNINDSDIRKFMRKVNIISDEGLSKMTPVLRPAIVEIIMNNGFSYIKRVDLPKGEPENPLSPKEQISKFKYLASYGGMSEATAEQIITCVLNIENKISSLYKLLN